MIIGNGNIASVLVDRDDVTFFASGTSNSAECDEAVFEREKKLILSQDREKHFVYFSSLSIYYSDNDYNLHKKHMERIIKQWFLTYTIVRVGVIQWGKNPTTIINDFRRKIKEKQHVEIWDVKRGVVSLEEFHYWMSMIPVGEKNEMNITGRLMTAREIYNEIKEGKL